MKAGRPPPGGAASRAFERRVVVLPPGGRRLYRAHEWGDALVSIERGRIELECAGQPPRPFRRGHLLWFVGLGLRAIHNPGRVPAVLTATSRRRPAKPSNRRTPP
jgi:hypothetical protein